MSIGARTIKTGIAVALSVYICVLLDIHPALFAATSAVVCMQQSIGRSLKNALEQLIVNISAIIIGIVLGLAIPIQYLSMALATVIVILFCTQVFKAPNLIVMAIITTIFIIGSPQEQFIDHAVMRALAILIGIGIANIINFTLVPPHYQKSLQSKLIELNNLAVPSFISSVNEYLHLDIQREEEMKKSDEEFNAVYQDAENLLDLFRDEFKLTLGRENLGRKTAQELAYKEYLNYNLGLWQRSKDILFLAEERRMRVKEAYEPANSTESKQVYEMLFHVLDEAEHCNSELQKKLKDEASSVVPEPRVWSKLSSLFKEWQEKNPETAYYMHAVFEVAVITYNIRWFAKEASHLLNKN